MSAGDPEALALALARMRGSFDEVYAAPRLDASGPTEDLLLVEVAHCVYALRTSEIAGIAARPRIVALPGASSILLGLTALRGGVVPVCSLRALLGLGAGPSDAWIAWTRGPRPVAYAFDGFGGLFRVGPADLVAGAPDTVGSRGAARIDGVLHPLIDMSAVATLWARRQSNPLES